MTEEDKQLLLVDLCARLPYGVKFEVKNGDVDTLLELGVDSGWVNASYDIEEVKPYLRPMSSMTKEEKKEYEKVCELDTEILAKHPMNREPFPALYNSQDWLNKKMFDYRGLIEKGLALEAPNEMYEQTL